MANILGDHHRMFIQAFMWKKICSSQEVKSIYKKCHEKNGVPLGELKPFVEKINSALKPLYMSITKGIDELTGDHYYVLINEADNSLSRLSLEYKSNELELFKKIVSCIIESNEGKVQSTTVLNLADELRMSKKDVDEITTKLSQEGWLNEDGGYVYFSTRAISELQHFFKENFSDVINFCHLCKNIVFQGGTCNSCSCKIHFHCKESYFTDMGRSSCPSCQNPWVDDSS